MFSFIRACGAAFLPPPAPSPTHTGHADTRAHQPPREGQESLGAQGPAAPVGARPLGTGVTTDLSKSTKRMNPSESPLRPPDPGSQSGGSCGGGSFGGVLIWVIVSLEKQPGVLCCGAVSIKSSLAPQPRKTDLCFASLSSCPPLWVVRVTYPVGIHSGTAITQASGTHPRDAA